MRKFLLNYAPWLITVAAIIYVIRDLDWQELGSHVLNGDPTWLLGAIILTILSYLFRSVRWLFFFPQISTLAFRDAASTLFLGFFMNNILPARAGELVRAHVGARKAGQKRTLVLATIASERLIDGLTISLFFITFALGVLKQEIADNLLYVVGIFLLVGVLVILTLGLQTRLVSIFESLGNRFDNRYSNYALNRAQVFIEGLRPLVKLSRLPALVFLSILIWTIELAVYYSVSRAFDVDLSLAYCVIFMVTVNFSSLIPAAPGAIGVIEAIATSVLVSLGLNKELALSMVLAQHMIQYLVVGLPGLIIMLRWKKMLKAVDKEIAENESE